MQWSMAEVWRQRRVKFLDFSSQIFTSSNWCCGAVVNYILHPIWQREFYSFFRWFSAFAFLFQSNRRIMQYLVCIWMYVCTFLKFTTGKGLHYCIGVNRQVGRKKGDKSRRPSDSCKISFPAGSCYRVASQTSILDHDDGETRMFSLFQFFISIST